MLSTFPPLPTECACSGKEGDGDGVAVPETTCLLHFKNILSENRTILRYHFCSSLSLALRPPICSKLQFVCLCPAVAKAVAFFSLANLSFNHFSSSLFGFHILDFIVCLSGSASGLSLLHDPMDGLVANRSIAQLLKLQAHCKAARAMMSGSLSNPAGGDAVRSRVQRQIERLSSFSSFPTFSCLTTTLYYSDSPANWNLIQDPAPPFHPHQPKSGTLVCDSGTRAAEHTGTYVTFNLQVLGRPFVSVTEAALISEWNIMLSVDSSDPFLVLRGPLACRGYFTFASTPPSASWYWLPCSSALHKSPSNHLVNSCQLRTLPSDGGSISQRTRLGITFSTASARCSNNGPIRTTAMVRKLEQSEGV